MLRKLLVTAVALVTTMGLMVPTASTASALGGEWLGCWVTPGEDSNWAPECWGGDTGGYVNVEFVVRGETDPLTYSWSVPALYQSRIYAGCGPTQSYCKLRVQAASHQITVSVTLTQNGASATHTAAAYVDRWCGWWC